MSEGSHQGRRVGIPDDNERQAGIPADNEANPQNPDPNQNSPPIPNYDNPSPDSTTPEDANANPGLGSARPMESSEATPPSSVESLSDNEEIFPPADSSPDSREVSSTSSTDTVHSIIQNPPPIQGLAGMSIAGRLAQNQNSSLEIRTSRSGNIPDASLQNPPAHPSNPHIVVCPPRPTFSSASSESRPPLSSSGLSVSAIALPTTRPPVRFPAATSSTRPPVTVPSSWPPTNLPLATSTRPPTILPIVITSRPVSASTVATVTSSTLAALTVDTATSSTLELLRPSTVPTPSSSSLSPSSVTAPTSTLPPTSMPAPTFSTMPSITSIWSSTAETSSQSPQPSTSGLSQRTKESSVKNVLSPKKSIYPHDHKSKFPSSPIISPKEKSPAKRQANPPTQGTRNGSNTDKGLSPAKKAKKVPEQGEGSKDSEKDGNSENAPEVPEEDEEYESKSTSSRKRKGDPKDGNSS